MVIYRKVVPTNTIASATCPGFTTCGRARAETETESEEVMPEFSNKTSHMTLQANTPAAFINEFLKSKSTTLYDPDLHLTLRV